LTTEDTEIAEPSPSCAGAAHEHFARGSAADAGQQAGGKTRGAARAARWIGSAFSAASVVKRLGPPHLTSIGHRKTGKT